MTKFCSCLDPDCDPYRNFVCIKKLRRLTPKRSGTPWSTPWIDAFSWCRRFRLGARQGRIDIIQVRPETHCDLGIPQFKKHMCLTVSSKHHTGYTREINGWVYIPVAVVWGKCARFDHSSTMWAAVWFRDDLSKNDPRMCFAICKMLCMRFTTSSKYT